MGQRKIIRSNPRQEGYNDISDTPVTKMDLADVMSGFSSVVRAEARAGTLEAINEHKKECKNDNDGRYVQKDTCQKRREICKGQVYDKIDKCTDGKHCPTTKEDEPEDPTINISITAKAFDHFRNNKLSYGLGGVSLVELIGLIIMILKDYIHFG